MSTFYTCIVHGRRHAIEHHIDRHKCDKCCMLPDKVFTLIYGDLESIILLKDIYLSQ